MKVTNIILASMFIILLSLISYGLTVETTQTRNTAEEGYWPSDDYNWTNVTDNNCDTYAVGGNGTLMVNFTKYNDSTASSKVQFTYNHSITNSTRVNYTLSDYLDCWNAYSDVMSFMIYSNDTTENITHSVISESFVWLNVSGQNLTVQLDNTRAFDLTIYNISTRTRVNESIGTWANATNMTTGNKSISSVVLYNCSNNAEVIGVANYTVFGSLGIIQANTNETIDTGFLVCGNYTYDVNVTVDSSNYTLIHESSTLYLSNDTVSGTTMGANYSYYTDHNNSNQRFCWNSNDEWEEIGSSVGEAAVYDIRMFWDISSPSSSWIFGLDSPAEYVTSTTGTMNFNWSVYSDDVDSNHTTFNCSVYTRMNNTASYTINISDIPTVNSSTVYSNATEYFNDGDRVWWKIVCEDEYEQNIANSTVRIFDVDTDYYTLWLGANELIGFHLDTGNITLYSPNGTDHICGVNDDSTFVCSGQ